MGQWTADEPFQPSPLTWSIERGTIDTVDPGPSERWAGVDGAPGREPADSTAAIQRALDSGASTVVLRHGTFWLSASLRIPPTVRRILRHELDSARVPRAPAGLQPRRSHALGRHRGGVRCRSITSRWTTAILAGQLGIRLDTSRPLLMRDIVSAGVVMLDRTPRGGQAVLEDVCCGPLLAAGSAPVTARQFNTEGGGVRIENRGAPPIDPGAEDRAGKHRRQYHRRRPQPKSSAASSTSSACRPPTPPPLFISRESSLAARLRRGSPRGRS